MQVQSIKTPRLILRPLALSDAVLIQRIASNRQIADTMISIPHPYPDGEAEHYIRRQLAELEADRVVTFAIDRQPDLFFTGVIEIREIDRQHSQAELSFWLANEAWGNGYMSEVIQPILQFCFEDLKLNRIYAYHLVRNPASGRVLQKNGFVQEGILRQRVRKWNVFEDVVVLAILCQDWQRKFI